MQCLKMSLTWAEEAVGQPWESNDPFQNIFLGRQHPCISPIRSSSPISSQFFPSSCGCFCSLFDQSFFMLVLKLGGSFPNSCTPGSPNPTTITDYESLLLWHVHSSLFLTCPPFSFLVYILTVIGSKTLTWVLLLRVHLVSFALTLLF